MLIIPYFSLAIFSLPLEILDISGFSIFFLTRSEKYLNLRSATLLLLYITMCFFHLHNSDANYGKMTGRTWLFFHNVISTGL